MKINYVIPALQMKGGIQEFALSIKNQVEKNSEYDIQLADFDYQVPYLSSLLVNKVPSFLKSLSAEKFIYPYLQRKNHLSEKGNYHCWHIDPSMYISPESKFVLTTHGLEILKKTFADSWYREYFAQKAVHRADAITCDSVYTKELLLSNFVVEDQSKIHVVYPPIEFEKYTSKPKQQGSTEFRIGTLCRLVHRKNVSGIIEALNILHSYFPDFTYILAGEGPEKDLLLSQLKKSQFKWEYLGAISDQEKIESFFPSLDVFVMPTLASENDVEGFGIVYLEANASGVPVVSSKSGGAAESIQQDVTGLFADPTDPSDIAKKIHTVLQLSDFNVEAMRAWAKSFDVAESARKFAEIYQQVF